MSGLAPGFWLRIPAQLAHDFAPIALKIFCTFREPSTAQWRPVQWRGLEFRNPLGIAGGVDKNAELVEEWWNLGCGFVEVGTVTPNPQGPNPGQIMARDLARQALWNKMGFPSAGRFAVRENLRDLPLNRVTPIFVNIGKNRETPLEDAARDYELCMQTLADVADAFVVNISSPNTIGLRELLAPHRLRSFLGAVISARNRLPKNKIPVLLKLSPDLAANDLANVVDVAQELNVDGYIATNTTLAREPGDPLPAEGGVSGAPLALRAKEVLRELISLLGPSRSQSLVISVGGVMTAADVFERLTLGADLVQVYSTLAFHGPLFFTRTADAWNRGK